MEEGCLIWWITFSFRWGGLVMFTWGRDGRRMHYGKAGWWDSVMLWTMFCWETLGPGIHVDVTLKRTPYLEIVADPVHSFVAMTTVPFFSWIIHPDTQQKLFRNGLKNMTMCSRYCLGLKFPRSQSNWTSMGCAGTPNLIHGGRILQLAGLLLMSWCQIPQDTSRGLVESMPQCIRAVLAAWRWAWY